MVESDAERIELWETFDLDEPRFAAFFGREASPGRRGTDAT